MPPLVDRCRLDHLEVRGHRRVVEGETSERERTHSRWTRSMQSLTSARRVDEGGRLIRDCRDQQSQEGSSVDYELQLTGGACLRPSEVVPRHVQVSQE